MNENLKIKMYSFTVDCTDPQELAKFYAALLEWEMGFYDEEYAWVYAPGTNQGTYPCILFQRNLAYQPPVWPEEPEAQQQTAHIDFAVTDLERAVEHAIHCGATVANAQFSDDWTVMLDPAEHPFCLCLMKAVFASAHFGLL
ncbi:MAG: VOC family protein [Eubacteriales bacterium]|nr:VOC family protein [Eubacteriales bacterium]